MDKTKQSAKSAELFTPANTVRGMYEKVEAPEGNKDKVAILKGEALSKDYRTPEYQLFRLQCGFGVHPERSGNACFGYFCADGEECRMEKYEFIGIADEETTAYAEELEAKWKNGRQDV